MKVSTPALLTFGDRGCTRSGRTYQGARFQGKRRIIKAKRPKESAAAPAAAAPAVDSNDDTNATFTALVVVDTVVANTTGQKRVVDDCVENERPTKRVKVDHKMSAVAAQAVGLDVGVEPPPPRAGTTGPSTFGTVVVNDNGQQYVEPLYGTLESPAAGAVADLGAPNPPRAGTTGTFTFDTGVVNGAEPPPPFADTTGPFNFGTSATGTFTCGTSIVHADVEPPPAPRAAVAAALDVGVEPPPPPPAVAVASLWAPNPNAVPTWRCDICNAAKNGLELNQCESCTAPRPE